MNSEIPTINNRELLNIRLLQKLSILSIDVVIGSLFCGVFVVKLLDVQPGFAWWIVLHFSVWIVYSLDHLIDGIMYKNSTQTLRQCFYYNHRKEVLILIFILSIINIILGFIFLEKQIIYFGLILGLFTGTYLLFVYFFGKKKQLLLQKELFVAIIYTTGIWGGPVSLLDYHLTIDLVIILLGFFLLVFADILILNLYEKESDRLNNFHSFVLYFGEKVSVYLIRILIFLVFFMGLYQTIMASDIKIAIASKLLMLMCIVLLVLLNYQGKFNKRSVYRVVGELVFWIPGLMLLF